jgi:hypothetical protein
VEWVRIGQLLTELARRSPDTAVGQLALAARLTTADPEAAVGLAAFLNRATKTPGTTGSAA